MDFFLALAVFQMVEAPVAMGFDVTDKGVPVDPCYQPLLDADGVCGMGPILYMPCNGCIRMPD